MQFLRKLESKKLQQEFGFASYYPLGFPLVFLTIDVCLQTLAVNEEAGNILGRDKKTNTSECA